MSAPSRGSLGFRLRRACILELLATRDPGDVLEVGCGNGLLLRALLARGWRGVGVDSSPEAQAEAARVVQGAAPILGDLEEVEGRFDLLIACEVLEHIEDDRGALRRWLRLLRPGGGVLVSVPAHRARWGPGDVWAGHVRRYERAELEALLRDVGIEGAAIRCYGFPLLNLVEPFRNWVQGRRMRREELERAADRTARSGVERGWPERLATRLAHPWVMLPFELLQRRFYAGEMGNGYVAYAPRVEAPVGAAPGADGPGG